MGDSATDAKSFFRRHWEGPSLGNYTRFFDRSLPRWSSSEVEEFIASDPVHGPILKAAQEAAWFGIKGSIIGAVSTAGIAWKYSRSLHGAGLSFLAGGIFGWTFGHEVANHQMQLYRLNTSASQTKFMEWWQSKCERQS